jgi:hypothetical protein
MRVMHGDSIGESSADIVDDLLCADPRLVDAGLLGAIENTIIRNGIAHTVPILGIHIACETSAQ